MNAYTINLPGFPAISSRIAVAKDGAEPVVLDDLQIAADGRAVTAASPFGPVSVALADARDGDAPAISVSASIDLAEPCRSIDLYPVFGVELENATHLFSHGRSMGGCKTAVLPKPTLTTEYWEDNGLCFTSYFQTIVSFADGKLHVTQPLRQHHITKVTGRADGTTIRDFAIATRFEFPAAGRLEATVSTFALVADGFKALCDYGDAQVAVAPAKEPQPVGWNSWDYYRWTITEDEVLKNADFIASDPVLSKHVKRIIVDDGWQYAYGEWDANSLFPSGMASLASRLRKMGFTPGLWIAPLVAEPHSRIAEWDPDMLALSEGGDPCLAFECMRRFGFILDPTVEKTRRFLSDLFTRYADYGYGYFKIDFLMQLFKAPRFHDNAVPRGDLLRMALAPIAAAARGRADILGCGYGYEAGDDMIHMVRAGGDIHATWGNAKRNAVAVASRAWASNRVWTTDPDFCVCRGPETSADPDLGRLQCLYVYVKPDEKGRGPAPGHLWKNGLDSILKGEARCLLSVAIVNGGAINLSDKLYVLNDAGLDLVRRTVAAERGSAPIPVDLFESDVASKWIQRTPSGFRALLVNWEDEPQELALDFGSLGLAASAGRDFWTDEDVAAPGGVLRAALAPHACRFVSFTL